MTLRCTLSAKILTGVCRRLSPRKNARTREEYQQLYKETAAAEKSKKKTSMDVRRGTRFEIVKLPGQPPRLAAKPKDKTKRQKEKERKNRQGKQPETAKTGEPEAPPIRFYVMIDELVDILTEAHRALKHGGKHRMIDECKKKYANVTEETIVVYLSLCKRCATKRNRQKRGLTTRPIISNAMNDRVQVDLIDMQSAAGGEFWYIMNVQDHLTKFVHLQPLRQKTAQFDRHFPAILSTLHPALEQRTRVPESAGHFSQERFGLTCTSFTVNRAPRHSQSQGGVERANQDVQVMLATWMADHRTSQWSRGLRWVASAKNRAVHQGTKASPYEAMFSRPMRVGISTEIPSAFLP
ncbi:KRAB-A domain-containing protein 2 [Frankliniella fusca]|uniref:KRAB-A domain-containing protein 2 n=1 Tax=Frankliniella fusca TaxID=407009 RepID=A0AAE1HBT3_9NEOP|nr:KRAB-A domain-containing protein 2 [Frankliniella fusca]